jgi:hypothetical protein
MFLRAESVFTYTDLHAMLGNRNAVWWLTPHAVVACEDERVVEPWLQYHHSLSRFTFNADGKEIFAWARSPEHLLEICDVILRLLVASVVHSEISRLEFS